MTRGAATVVGLGLLALLPLARLAACADPVRGERVFQRCYACHSVVAGEAFDDAEYPDLSGQWRAVNLGVGGQAAFDPTKAWGRAQQAPLTPEYRAILDASLADQANGGQGNWPSGARRRPAGRHRLSGARRSLPHSAVGGQASSAATS